MEKVFEILFTIALFWLGFRFFPLLTSIIFVLAVILWIVKWIVKLLSASVKIAESALIESKLKKVKFDIYFENTKELYQGTIHEFVQQIFILIYLNKNIISIDKLKTLGSSEGRAHLLELLKKEDEIIENIKLFLKNDLEVEVDTDMNKPNIKVRFISKKIDTSYELEMLQVDIKDKIKPLEDNFINMFRESKIKIEGIDYDYSFIEDVAYLQKALKNGYIKI